MCVFIIIRSISYTMTWRLVQDLHNGGGRTPEDSVNPVLTERSGAADLYHGSRV